MKEVILDTEAHLDAILRDYELCLADHAHLTLSELDSLTVAEILIVAETAADHPVAPQTFAPSTTTIGDVVAFCSQYRR
ncbi:MAG: hypothetical protein ACSLFB_09510 [Acidimicrobiales bacterium]